MSDLQAKTDEELNVMLAECLGWKCTGKSAIGRPIWTKDNWTWFHSDGLPQFCASLDEVARVEAGLRDEQREPYVRCLQLLHNTRNSTWWDVATATARHRTIALIQTLQPSPHDAPRTESHQANE